VHSVEGIYLRQWCFDASKPRVAASTGAQYHQYVGFSRRNKIPRCSAYAMGESNPVPASGYDPDRAQNLISSSMSRHLSTRNMSSKSMHAFLSNLAHRQTDKRTRACGRKHILPPLSEVNLCHTQTSPRRTRVRVNSTLAMSAGRQGQSTLLAGTTSALSPRGEVLALTDPPGGQFF